MTQEALTSFLGWCTLINYGFLGVSTILVLVFEEQVKAIHGALFGLGDEDLSRAYFRYLARYKVLVIIFNFVPWLVLYFIMG